MSNYLIKIPSTNNSLHSLKHSSLLPNQKEEIKLINSPNYEKISLHKITNFLKYYWSHYRALILVGKRVKN